MKSQAGLSSIAILCIVGIILLLGFGVILLEQHELSLASTVLQAL